MNITVLGAGAWGTALAVAAAPRHAVTLWARDASQAMALRAQGRNQRYLPEVPLPPSLVIEPDLAVAVADAELVVIATPMAGLRAVLRALPPGVPALWLCKGFEQGTGRLGHEVALAERAGAPCGVLSGPSFALEVARGQPTALVVASTDASLASTAVAAFHSPALRVYTSDDVVGVEVGGAVKNVLAIATGIVDGMPQPGLNARAALITRGLAEMTRLGLALGARADTFMGLSGLGDLVLTATGDLSRNRRVGLLLAQGRPLKQIVQELGHVAEGVYSAATVLARARQLGVDMPITEAVVAVLDGGLTPVAAMAELMGRQARPEAVRASDSD
jgi:glycerol-3-phosphate dehydrogenase (NAD(P)+)